MDFTKFETISIKTHPELSEKWVQACIAEDPSILGLGDVILKDKEHPQPKAGRLDLLLRDESNRRYEVEVQLGSTDGDHIMRTIEYWDIERRRFPMYEHIAVIVAEDITSRFLNVISLFNGMIPLIAIQMKALKNANSIGLIFTTVMDQMTLGLVDEDEEPQEKTDRAYWEKRGSTKTLTIADERVENARNTDKDLEMNYTKFYIGLAKGGQPRNFVIFRPKKRFLVFEPRLKRTPETQENPELAGLDLSDYDIRTGRYRIKLQPDEVETYHKELTKVVSQAFAESNKE